MIVLVPRRTDWTTAIEALDPALPGADAELFERIAHELDRFHALGPFERRVPAFRILDDLAGWARTWGGQGTRYERILQRFWDPVQAWLRTEVVDIFAGEACVATSMPAPRFVCAQAVGTTIALFLFHPPTRGLGVLHLSARLSPAVGAEELVHGLERRLASGWQGAEMEARFVGGVVGRDEARLAALRDALLAAGVSAGRIQPTLSPRSEEDGVLHLCFDRTEGWVRPFHPGYDPVHYNLRTTRERERCRVEGLKESPSLLWPFEESR